MLDPNELPLARCCASPTAPPPGSPCPARRPYAARPDLEGPGRAGPAAAARLRRRGQPAAPNATSPTGSTAAAASTGCSRRCCWASAASGRSAPTAGSPATPPPRSSTPTRATPASSAWSGCASWPTTGSDFDAALEAVRAGTVFTTHTPVPAGIDRFDRELVARHLGDGGELPGVDIGRILELGRGDPPGRRPQPLQHGRDGPAAGPARQRRVHAARRRQPGDVRRAVARASTPRTCRSPRSPTGCTPPPGWRPRCSGSAPGSSAPSTPRTP